MVHQRQPPVAGRHTRTRRYAQTLFTRKGDDWYKTSYLFDRKQSMNGMAKKRYTNYKKQPA